jgi:Tol biopolymer transport system component
MNVTILPARRRTRVALATALLGAACVAPTDASSVDGQSAAPALARSTTGSTPAIFAPDVISDDNEQWRITFTPDGKTAYFAESPEFFPFTRQATIYVSTFVKGAWTEPVVAPFSGEYSDIDPFLSPNGQRLYFSSIRPVDGVMRGDIDLWMVERTSEGWSEPVNLGPAVNDPNADELYPSVSADGTLYFASGPFFPQPGLDFDIYRAERDGDGFAPREELGGGVNTQPSPSDAGLQDAWEFNPEISVDGKTLVFTSLRPGGFGLGDLYVSHLVQGEWSAARNLGALVNTTSDEYHPTLSRNARELFFVRRIPFRGDFYRVSTAELGLR